MKTYWNGEPCKATKVRVIVDKSPRPTWWCADLEGKIIDAIRIECPKSEPFYIVDELSSWDKITRGFGSPSYGHRSVPAKEEVQHDPT